MERFTKIVNDFYQLTFFSKRSILDIWEGCEYAYVIYDIYFQYLHIEPSD